MAFPLFRNGLAAREYLAEYMCVSVFVYWHNPILCQWVLWRLRYSATAQTWRSHINCVCLLGHNAWPMLAKWWKYDEDDGGFVDHVRPVWFLCDLDAVDGARVYEPGAFTPKLMWYQQLLDAAEVLTHVANVGFEFPGWDSLSSVLDLVNVTIRSSIDDTASPIRGFMIARCDPSLIALTLLEDAADETAALVARLVAFYTAHDVARSRYMIRKAGEVVADRMSYALYNELPDDNIDRNTTVDTAAAATAASATILEDLLAQYGKHKNKQTQEKKQADIRRKWAATTGGGVAAIEPVAP